ncbi:MAG: filamentous hemagglutinin N-terminal domain-containing protein [Rubrivivax sp.]|nr:filamentous hemagglutinin N-terminal domain-containing protein [Rubrivivax sp.]
MKSTRLSPTAAVRAARRPAPHPVARAARELLAPAGAALALGLVPPMPAFAGPQGGHVSAGQASIQVQGATTTVQQTSARAAIDWQSFSIGAHETVRFQQPGAAAVVLNRVVGPDPSAIFGRITANGQVLLINPNGILFGRSAQVDVGGLVASTANVSNADFMAGRLSFTQPGRPGAAVVNEGRITVAEGGLAALVGRTVANRGVIEARLGTVALAGGDAFVLDLYGDRLVNLAVDPEALATLTDAQGVPLAARVDQQGRIHADGGVVQLSAATVSRLVDSLINVGGTVRATSFEEQPGRIVLRGDQGTKLHLAGSVDVSGVFGGRIDATAGRVNLASTAHLDAGGDLGGGRIAVGGEWQGGGELPHAKQVDVAQGARLDASARQRGDGGTVVVWSDGDTRFEGRIAARGGSAGGDGGQVEVSGRQRLGFDGDVIAAAGGTGGTGGRAGMLLLDPQNLVIDGSSGSTTLPGADTPGDYTVRASALNRQLVNGTSVTLQATQDLTLTAGTVVDARATSGATPGAGLTLTAGRDIALNGLIILTDGAFTATAGGRFTQAADGAVATGNGAIGVTAAGNLAASNLLTSGALTLRSTAGSVNVSRAVSGLAGRGGALNIEGRDGVTLGAGALVGVATLTSAQGAVDTSAATLDAGGAIALTGASVNAGALITPATVTVTSAGAVSLGAVAGAAGGVNAQTAKAQGLTIATPGAVTLNGAALGAGGLALHSATAGERAGAVGLGAASVFSDGAVSVRASSITLAAAGIASGGALTLDAGASLSTGSGKLQSTGPMTLAAGSTATLGSGGAESGAALAISGDALQLDGDLRSAAEVQLQAAQAIALNRNVNAASFGATAGAGFTQAAGSAVAAGDVTIASTGALSASNLIATGAVTLSSSQGAVNVSGALASGADRTARIGSLQASGRDGVTLGAGALVAGTTTLSAAQGAVTTTGATIDSVGAVTIDGASVATGALVTPAAVTVTSAGAVSLGAVAGAAGTVNDQTAKSQGLTVATPGAVTLAGAALGAGGLTVRGATAGDRAGVVDFGAASVFSDGDVVVRAAGITLAGATGVDSAGALTLDAAGALTSGTGALVSGGATALSSGAALSIGSGGVDAGGALTLGANTLAVAGALRSGAAMQLQSTQATTLGGNVQAGSFSATAGGALTHEAAAAIEAGTIVMTVNGDLATGRLVSTGAVALTSSHGAVNVRDKVAGGATTPAASLSVSGRDGVTMGGDLLVAGTTTLASALGAVTTTGATLDSGGAITISGTSVSAGALVTPAAVAVTSAGPVSLGAVAGAAGTVNEQTAKSQGLTVATPGAVTLGGAALGAGGLTVRGATAGDRAGAVDFGAASVFSDGDVVVRAAGITLAGATGVDSAGALTLDAAGTFTSGSGALSSTGATSITAGGALALGSGGVDAGSALMLDGGTLSVAGALRSGAAMQLQSTQATTLAGNVQAGSFSATAGGALTHEAAAAIEAGTIVMTVTGDLATGRLVSAGAVALTSSQGAVNVRDKVAGGATTPAASLSVSGRDGVTMGGDLLVAGTTTLASAQGAVTTTAATLDSGGAVTLSGATVATGALVTPAAVTVTSAGAVSLGAVAGAAGTVNDQTAKAEGLTVATPGAVMLAGAALGAGGLAVHGASAADRAGAVDFGAASVFSDGDVRVDAASVTFGSTAGIATAGALTLDTAGGLASAGALLEAATTLTLRAGSTLAVGTGGARAGGALTLGAAGDIVAAGPLKTRGGTIAVTSTGGSVALDEIFTWEAGVADSGRLVVQAAQDVTLAKPLGGANTGYRLLADRYQPDLRPEVGAVAITAGRDVELNGLNLDGSDGTTPGLEVVAGGRLVSNALIGVNQGDIRLSVTGSGPLDGIYLGNSVYSRGLDQASGKTGYSVTVGGTGAAGTRGRLVLFDNTDDFAINADGYVLAKIVIANNVANYRRPSQQDPQVLEDDPTLVEATNQGQLGVTVGADTLSGLVSAPGPVRLTAMPDSSQLTYLGNAVNGQGISMKVQVFRLAGDAGTEPLAVQGDNPPAGCNFGDDYFTCGFEYVSGVGWDRDNPNPNSNPPGRPARVVINNQRRPELGLPGVIGYQLPAGTEGTATGFVDLVSSAAGYAPSIETEIQQDAPFHDPSDPAADPQTGWVFLQTGTVGYRLYGRIVQSDDTAGTRVSRVLIAPGTLQTDQLSASFNTSGGLNSGDPSTGNPNGSSPGGGANSNPGFSSVGGFGAQNGTTVSGAAGGGGGPLNFGVPGTVTVGGASGGAGGPVGFGPLAGGGAGNGNGNATGTGVSFGTLAGGAATVGAGNGFTLPPPGSLPGPDVPDGGGDGGGTPSTLRPNADLPPGDEGAGPDDARDTVIGSRPAALADLGRGPASSGSAPNVLRKRFRLAVAADESVCAPGDLQPAGGASNRLCPPDR